MRSRRVAAGNNEIRANMTLVSEQMLLEHRHASNDAWLAACGKRMKLEL